MNNDERRKTKLHDELLVLLPQHVWRRLQTRMIVHALIELEVVTTLECAYDECSQDDRRFVAYDEGGPRHAKTLTIDHVVSRSDGGHDRPSNLQLMHFGCNSGKGARDAAKNPAVRQKMSDASRRRWADPAQRASMVAQQVEAQARPDVKARKSESMKEAWARRKENDAC